jgi:hypothetical protein
MGSNTGQEPLLVPFSSVIPTGHGKWLDCHRLSWCWVDRPTLNICVIYDPLQRHIAESGIFETPKRVPCFPPWCLRGATSSETCVVTISTKIRAEHVLAGFLTEGIRDVEHTNL